MNDETITRRIGEGWTRNQKTEFKVGLCGCFSSIPNCCAVCCCEPCMWGRIAQKVDFLGIKGLVWTIILTLLTFTVVLFDALNKSATELPLGTPIPQKHIVFGMISFGLTVVYVVLTCSLRTRVRQSNNITGTSLCDFFASLCCGCCSICQMSTEAGLDENSCDLCNYPEPEII